MAREPLTEQETDSRGDLYHDEHTLKKVYDAIGRAGITSEIVQTDIILEMQNAGILFRERGRL